jgi:hypothetical protein
VLVCGGRDFGATREERLLLRDTLDRLGAIQVLIEGGAHGADRLAAEWAAAAHSVSLVTFPARWQEHGKAAGPIRNQQMLDEGKPDLVLAFPGGRGTADMVSRARRAGVLVREWK